MQQQPQSSEVYRKLSLDPALDYCTWITLYDIGLRLKELEDKGIEIQEGAVERAKMLVHRDSNH